VPRVFVGNFDFEHELANGLLNSSSKVRDIANEFISTWLAVTDADDCIWSPGGVPAFDFRELVIVSGLQPRFICRESDLPCGPNWQLVPWGWTVSVLNWGLKFGWTCPAPPLEVVRLVNSRAFRFKLENQFQVALPQAAVLTSIEQLLTHIESFTAGQPETDSAGWVLKANFGMSGRERQLGRGARVTVPILNWAKRRLQQSAAIVFEPWLDRVAEVGIQIDIPQHGVPQVLGILPLLTDTAGTYRGSRIQCEPSANVIWQSAAELAVRVAQEVQILGYFGPLGIDAMQYRDHEGTLQIRLLQDLNARYTMGRLGVGLRRLVAKQHAVDWLHDLSLVTQAHATRIVPITERSWLVEY
jgi:hypothetical protein